MGARLRGLLPEGRDTPSPTAKALRRPFREYALGLMHHADGDEAVPSPKLRPFPAQSWAIMGLAPLPA